MNFYESVFIIRQDISSLEIDKITEKFSKIITDAGCEVIKTEYWGLLTLAYKINNNKKGHYILLGIRATHDVIIELERRMKLSEDIIRYVHIKVDSISSEPSPILKNENSNNEEVVHVTITKESKQ